MRQLHEDTRDDKVIAVLRDKVRGILDSMETQDALEFLGLDWSEIAQEALEKKLESLTINQLLEKI